MLELSSCRNCIHNPSQGVFIGGEQGYCLIHETVLRSPATTTCRSLHRKDMPAFVVEEGVREHAAEFAPAWYPADIRTKQRLEIIHYSERHCWVTRSFDPLLHAVAQCFKTEARWIYVQMLASPVDGRWMLAHASLLRRYMAKCDKWQSTYRLVLELLDQLSSTPVLPTASLDQPASNGTESSEFNAFWEVVYVRISTVQEYGWMAGLEGLQWVTDRLDGALTEFDWPKLRHELSRIAPVLVTELIDHAEREGVFFPPVEPSPEHVEGESEPR